MELKEGFIICSNDEKKIILQNQKSIKNYIFITFEELVSKLLGKASPKGLLILMKEYNLSYDLAKEYIKYMPYIDNKCYSSLKLDSIVSAKNLLIEKELFNSDKLFIYRLNQFPVTFINPENSNTYKYIKSIVSKYTEVYEANNELFDYEPKVYSLDNYLNEALYVMNRIKDLIKSGISMDNIYILNMDKKSEFIFKRLQLSYNIPISFNFSRNINSFDEVKLFIDRCKCSESFYNVLESIELSPNIRGNILKIIIDYDLYDDKPLDYIEFLINKFKELSIEENNYLSSIRTTRLNSYKDNDYVFYLNFNQGMGVKIYQDDEYLKDEELLLINNKTSLDKNKLSHDITVKLIKNTKNLVITYRLLDGKEKLYPDNLVAELGLEVSNIDSYEYGYSKLEDNIHLGELYTKYLKYKELDNKLVEYDLSSLDFNSYDNKFNGISKKLLDDKYNEKELSLSYSSMKLYYMCPFAYYLDKVLGLNDFESNMAARLGSFSHSVLEKSYKEDFDFNEAFNDSLIEFSEEENYKDYFYFNQMKIVLSSIIEFNKRHEDESSLDNVLVESNIRIQKDGYSFLGFIDKLMYKIIDNEVYVAIIDYKTGKDIISLDNVEDGFNLQLPSYMYLLSNYEKFKGLNIHILGIYLQKVNIIALDNTIDIVAQREKSFRLQGYSTCDKSMLSMLDPNYEASDYIMSMKTLKDGSFAAYTKVISNDDSNYLIETVDYLIDKAAKSIKNGEFGISPKMIDGKNKSCTYCKYYDICYKKFEDIIELELKPFSKKGEE